MLTEIVRDFITEAEDKAGELNDWMKEIDTGKISAETINAIFRWIHSLKGGSSFLIDELADLGVFSKFCHEFENFLDLVRKGNLPFDARIGKLVNRGMLLVVGDLETLVLEKAGFDHADFSEELTNFSLATVEIKDRFIVFHIARDIRLQEEVNSFGSLVIKETEEKGRGNFLVIDTAGEFKLSSLAGGAVLGYIGAEVEKVFFIRPSAYMRSLVQRFGSEEDGVYLRETLAECEEAIR